jgi:transcription initiation factor TFIIB
MHGFQQIRRITSVLEIADSLRDQACALFRTAQSADLLRGRSIEGIAAGCVYAVARTNGLPRTVEEVAEHAPVGRTKVEGSYRTLNAELGLPAKPISPSAFVPRSASELDVPDRVRRRAHVLVEAAVSSGMANGVRPSGFAAACLYAAGKDSSAVTQLEVARAAKTSDTTIRNHLSTLDGLAET